MYIAVHLMLSCGINEIWSSKGGFPVDVFGGIVPISIFGVGCETEIDILCVMNMHLNVLLILYN